MVAVSAPASTGLARGGSPEDRRGRCSSGTAGAPHPRYVMRGSGAAQPRGAILDRSADLGAGEVLVFHGHGPHVLARVIHVAVPEPGVIERAVHRTLRVAVRPVDREAQVVAAIRVQRAGLVA